MFITHLSILDELELDDLRRAHPIVDLKFKDLEEECILLTQDNTELQAEIIRLEKMLDEVNSNLH